MKRKPEPEQPKAADTRTVLMRWRCPICGIHTCGFVTPEDSGIRYCLILLARFAAGTCWWYTVNL